MKRTLFITMLSAALMGSAYANTNYTATPGTDCSPPSYVYGTYADTGEASSGSVEVFEVSAPEGYMYLVRVFGGYTKTGDATGNTVTMNGGWVTYSVYCGYVYDSGDATGNTVTMNGGVVSDGVYGGFVYSSGKATDNTVTMTGGEVGDHVYGGYTFSGDATGNTVDMTGGVVDLSVFGGYTYSGNATENAVTINDGYVRYSVYCGYVYSSGNATGNTVTMTGGEVGEEVCGGYTYSGNATGNAVDMTGGEVGYNVYGGYSYSGNATENAVTINDGYVDNSVYGGKTYSGDACGNTVTIADSTVSGEEDVGCIYGGNTEEGDANDNTVTVTGGQAEAVLGGIGNNANGNIVTVTDATIEYEVYGGLSVNSEGVYSGTANDNTVTMNGGQVGEICAAKGYSTIGNTVVMNGGLAGSIVAGTSYGGENSGNTVIVTEGVVRGGIGGGYLYDDGELRDNRVYLVGKGATATIGGKQYTGGAGGIQAGAIVAAMADEDAYHYVSSGNSIDVYGTGITAGMVGYMETLTFHLGDGLASAGTPMLTITDDGLDLVITKLGFRGDDVTDWSKFEGRSITLVQAADNVTGVVDGTEVDIINEVGGTLATATLTLGSGNALVLTFSGELPGGQTSYTAIPGSPQTSAPDTIYGAYAETGDVTGGSTSVYAVATGGYESLGDVYGGYAKSGNVSGCTANMDSGSAEFVYGGICAVSDYSECYDATDNTVTVNGGEVAWDVEGGNTLIGNASGNTVNMNGGKVVRNVEGGVSYVGNASGNTVNMSGGEVGKVFGGSTNDGDATGNTVSMTGGEVADTLYGGYTTLGNATDNTVSLSDGDVGWYLYGGYVSEVSDDGNASGNTVIMNGGEVGVDVYGGIVKGSGDATGNTVILNNGDVNDDVCAGLSYKGDVSGNIVMMTGGSVSTGVYGAYTYDGNATDNTVIMTGGSAGYVYGGGGGADSVCVATDNTVNIAGGYVYYDVYGGYVDISGDATGNTVTMSGGEVADVYGGYVDISGNATGNTVTMTGGAVEWDVVGGGTYSGDATGNTVILNNGEVGRDVFGGFTDSGNATDNTVIINGGAVDEWVSGGETNSGDATGNTVIMTGGEVGGSLNGGYAYSGDATGNMVRLVGAGASYTVGDTTYQGGEIAIHGSVSAGLVKEGGTSENNTVHIHGTGINIGGTMEYSQQLNFHLVQGQAGAPGTPMVTLGGTDGNGLDLEGVELGFYGDAVTDWAAFNGKSITLVSMTNETITGLVQPTDSVDITDEAGKTVATATLTLSEDLQTLFLTDIQGVGPVPPPPPVPSAEADALDVTLVNSLWASSAYVREFVRLSEAQGYALKSGDTAVWGGGFGTFMHVTGDKGFKSNGGGYGIGVRHAFSANTQAGISFGQGFGSYHNSGMDGATVHQRAILAAATASTRIGKDFSLGGHLAYGSVRNRADCRLDGESGRARWNDNVFNLGVQAAYDFHVTEATAITPFLGLDWMNGAHESFSSAYGRHYSHGRLNELRMPVGVTVSTSTEVGSTKLLPQLSVAYVPSLAQQVPHADVTGADGDYRVKSYAPGRNAFMLNAGVNAVFSDSWSAGAFYTLETRRHSVDQSVNASVRYTF